MTSPSIQAGNSALYYINGLQLSYLSTTTIGISAGFSRDQSNDNDMFLSQNAVISTGKIGVNGLDSAAIAANTKYAVYVIGNSFKNSPVVTIASPNFVQPNFPAGYNIAYRIGMFITDSSSHIVEFYQAAATNSTLRRMVYADSIALLFASTGTTSTTSTAWDKADMTPYLPFANAEVELIASLQPNAASDTLFIVPDGAVTSVGSKILTGQVAAVKVDTTAITVTKNYGVDTRLSTASATGSMWLSSYVDSL